MSRTNASYSITLSMINFSIIIYLQTDLPSGLLLSGFLVKTVYEFLFLQPSYSPFHNNTLVSTHFTLLEQNPSQTSDPLHAIFSISH